MSHRDPSSSFRRRIVSLAVAGALLCAPLSSGCYGKFALTRNVYNFNGAVGPFESLHSVLMWVFTPVYIVTIAVDALVLNTIQFWTGLTIPVLAEVETDAGTTRVVVLAARPPQAESATMSTRDSF